MNDWDSEKRTLGEELFELGWKQGTLFYAPSACFSWNKLSGNTPDNSIVQEMRKLGSKEKFVLITQDCDLIASEAEEPYIEAILCKTEKQRFVSKINAKSARWFVVDAQTGLVAHAKYRTQFDKKILSSFTPEPWPNGPNRLDEFIRWLARRYDRPSIPDAIVDAFQRPLDRRVAELKQMHPTIFAAFNGIVSDVRVKLPASEIPPFNLQLILLIKSEELSEEEANAMSFFEQAVRESLDTTLVNLDPDMRIVSEEEISMKEYYASRPIYLGDYTYQGGEIEGARPHERD